MPRSRTGRCSGTWGGSSDSIVGTTFKKNNVITVFRELRYFTGMTNSGPSGAFFRAYSLVYADVRNVVTFNSAGAYTGMFEECTKLDHAVLGNVVSMKRVFVSCPKLRWVVIYATAVPSIWDVTFPSNTKIYVPDESVDSYKEASVWSSIASRIFPFSQFLTDFPGETRDL